MEASEYGHFPQQATPERRLSCDPFIVEDLLDFSNHDCVSFDNQFHHTNNNNNNNNNNPSSSSLPPNNTHHSNCNSDSSNVVTPVDSCNSSFSGNNDIVLAPPSDNASHFSGELCVPYDDLAELEWLSNFVEESFSSEDLHKFQLIPTMSLSAMKTRPDEGSETRYYSSQPVKTEPPPTSPLFSPEMPVPGKARSKRSRNAPCNWASRLLVVSPEASEHAPTTKPIKPAGPKKKNMGLGGVGPMVNSPPNGEVRKCLHCATDKTPQWRTGPMGPKTLCNACGVRYKSGRLVPEYRPAASPTFMLTKHSNSHRKVMELRRQKEFQRQQHVHHQHQQQYQHQHQHQLIHHNPEITCSMLFDPSSTDDYLIHQHIGPDFRQLI